MEYNKSQFSKAADKKVLHKVKKQWVVLSTALLMAVAGGATLLGGTSANADTANNSSNANQNSATETVKNQINASLSKVSQQNQSNSQNKVQNNNSNQSISNQANALHNRILANATSADASVNNQKLGAMETLNGRNLMVGKAATDPTTPETPTKPQSASVKNPVNIPSGTPTYHSDGNNGNNVMYQNVPITVAFVSDGGNKLLMGSDGKIRMKTENVVLSGKQSGQAKFNINTGNGTTSDKYAVVHSDGNGNDTNSVYSDFTVPSDFQIANSGMNNSITANLNDGNQWTWNKPKDATNMSVTTDNDTHITSLNSDANWDNETDRPLVVLKPKTANSAKNIVVNYVNQSGQDIREDQWGGNGATSPANKKNVIQAPSDFGTMIDVTNSDGYNKTPQEFNNNGIHGIANPDPNDYTFVSDVGNNLNLSTISASDGKVKTHYLLDGQQKDVTLPVVGKTFAENKAEANSDNKFTATVNLKDNEGNSHTITVTKYLGGQIGSYYNQNGITANDVMHWITESSDKNNNITVSGLGTIDGIGLSASNFANDAKVDWSQSNNPQSVYFAGDGAGHGKMQNKAGAGANPVTGATYNFMINPTSQDNRNNQHSAKVVVNFINRNNPSDQKSQTINENALNGFYGSTVDIMHVPGHPITVPTGYILQAGQDTNYTVSEVAGNDDSNVVNLYYYVTGQQRKLGKNGTTSVANPNYQPGSSKKSESSPAEHNSDYSKFKININANYYTADGKLDASKGKKGTVTYTVSDLNGTHDDGLVGNVGDTGTFNPDDFSYVVENDSKNYNRTTDTLADNSSEAEGYYFANSDVYDASTKHEFNGNSITFNYNVHEGSSAQASARSHIYFHYVTASDPNNDITSVYNQKTGQWSDGQQTTVSDNDMPGAPIDYNKETQSVKENVPSGYQFVRVMGNDAHYNLNDDNNHTISSQEIVTPASNGQLATTYGPAGNATNQDDVIEVVPKVQNIKIHYINQDNNTVGSDTLNSTYTGGYSRYGETVNLSDGTIKNQPYASKYNNQVDKKNGNGTNTDPGIGFKIPQGYHVDPTNSDNGAFLTIGSGHDGSFADNGPFNTTNSKVFNVHVTGDQQKASDETSDIAHVLINEKNPDGVITNHYTISDAIDGEVGDTFQLNASSFQPSGYLADASDQPGTGQIQTDGTISPSHFVFNYTKQTDPNWQDLKPIMVTFSDGGHQEGYYSINPSDNSKEDQTLNVLTGNGVPSNTKASDELKSINPDYTLVPGQSGNASFSDSHSNIINLKVYNKATQAAGDFTLLQNLFTNGNSTGSRIKSIAMNGQKGTQSDLKPSNFSVKGYTTDPSDNNIDVQFQSDGTISPVNGSWKYTATNSSNDTPVPNPNKTPFNPNEPIGPGNPLPYVPASGGTPSDPTGPMNSHFDPNKPVGPNNYPYAPEMGPADPVPGNPNGAPSNPSDYNGKFGPSNSQVAQPIFVQYYLGSVNKNNALNIAKNGDQITANGPSNTDNGGANNIRIDGNMDQSVSDISQAAMNTIAKGQGDVPTGYYLAPDQDLDYTFGTTAQQVNLVLKKASAKDKAFTIHTDYEQTDGTISKSDKTGTRSLEVLDNTSDNVLPSDYNSDVSNYKLDTSNSRDQSENVINNNGTLTPGSSVNFYYEPKTAASDTNMQNINVHYVDEADGSDVTSQTFTPGNTDQYGKHDVNVENGNLPNGYKVDGSLKVNPASLQEEAYFDYPQNFTVYVQGSQYIKAGNFNVYYKLIGANGQPISAGSKHATDKYSNDPDMFEAKNYLSNVSDEYGDNYDLETSSLLSDLSDGSKHLNSDGYNVVNGVDPTDVKIHFGFNPADHNHATLNPSDHTYVFTQAASNKANPAGLLTVHFLNSQGQSAGLPDQYVYNQSAGTTISDILTNNDKMSTGASDGINLPNGYTAIGAQIPSTNAYPGYPDGVKLTGNPATVNITVKGQPENKDSDLTVERMVIDRNGNRHTLTPLTGQRVSGNVGSDVTVDGANYMPTDGSYHIDPDFATATVRINDNNDKGTSLTPNKVLFVYEENKVADAAPMYVRYFNEYGLQKNGKYVGTYVGGGKISGLDNNGKEIDVTNPNGGSDGNGVDNHGINGVAIPDGYTLASDGPDSNPNQRTDYIFDGDTHVINLNVEGVGSNPNQPLPSDIYTNSRAITVHLHENGGSDKVTTVYDKKPTGQSLTLNPNQFTAYLPGYHATLSDSTANVTTQYLNLNDYIQNYESTHGNNDPSDIKDGAGNVLAQVVSGSVRKANGKVTGVKLQDGTKDQFYTGLLYTDPTNVYFNYNQNDKLGAPIKLVYENQDGNDIADTTLSGNLDQKVNVTDPREGGLFIPKGYTLDGGFQKNGINDKNDKFSDVANNQDLIYGFKRTPQTVYLHVTGNQANQNGIKIGNVMIQLDMHNANGSVTQYRVPYTPKQGLNDASNVIRYGDAFQITASDAFNNDGNGYAHSNFTGYQAANSDQTQFGHVASDGSVSPNEVTFNFYANGQAQNTGYATIHYYDTASGKILSDYSVHGNIGNQIGLNNVQAGSDYNPMPAGYQSDGNVPTHYFSNTTQNIFVPVKGKSVSHPQPFYIYAVMEDGNGNIMHTQQIQVTGLSSNVGGNGTTISPYSYVNSLKDENGHSLSGYHVAPGDKAMTLYYDQNGNLQPVDGNSITYVYQKGYSPVQIGSYTVHYYTGTLHIDSGNGNASYSGGEEVDAVQDHGIEGNNFDIKPYEKDIPDQLGTQYQIDVDPNTGKDNVQVVQKNGKGNTTYQGNPIDSNLTYSGDQNIYIKIDKNS